MHYGNRDPLITFLFSPLQFQCPVLIIFFNCNLTLLPRKAEKPASHTVTNSRKAETPACRSLIYSRKAKISAWKFRKKTVTHNVVWELWVWGPHAMGARGEKVKVLTIFTHFDVLVVPVHAVFCFKIY